MFRTPSGQTGTAAYLFEAARIANAQRKLDARMARLSDIITEETQDDPIMRPAYLGKTNKVVNMNVTAVARVCTSREAGYLAKLLTGTNDNPARR